ncbi:hypothetical protein NE237_003596 [Protea cynaroides]|uniref:Uncharacterized protein n=1 Tax=Protea cynaroides TaxID=273540 RepID=A0A9Q0QSS1_9MAGN|nr:hypothetical protein NE237_003596 [Protea cynaroides]
MTATVEVFQKLTYFCSSLIARFPFYGFGTRRNLLGSGSERLVGKMSGSSLNFLSSRCYSTISVLLLSNMLEDIIPPEFGRLQMSKVLCLKEQSQVQYFLSLESALSNLPHLPTDGVTCIIKPLNLTTSGKEESGSGILTARRSKCENRRK